MNEENSLAPDSKHHTGKLPELLAAQHTIGLAVVCCTDSLYGIDVKWVREIRPLVGVTPVYGLSSFWVGLTALRGHLYAVLDLQQILVPQPTPTENGQQIIFTAVNQMLIGLLVAELPTMRQVDAQAITAFPVTETPYVLGITPDEIIVLDLPGLFADLRLTALASQADNAE